MSALDPKSICSAKLPSQAELIAAWSWSSEPEISIICNTFNHERYIELALRSFLLQKSDKAFEIIVHDDASSDGTTRILRAFAEAYPAIFRTIFQSENQFSQGRKPTPIALEAAKGRYIALCEGDDFWCDDSKLRLQWQVLERDRSLAACSAHAAVVDGDGNMLEMRAGRLESRITQSDLLLGRKNECRTCTLMIRRSSLPRTWPRQALQAYAFDNFLRYLISSSGDILVLPTTVSCYRIHENGVWSSLQSAQQKDRRMHDLKLMLALVPDDRRNLVEYRMARLAMSRSGGPFRERVTSVLAFAAKPKWFLWLVGAKVRAGARKIPGRSRRPGC